MVYDEATGSVVLFGGLDCTGESCYDLPDTWTWDGNAWTQQHPASSPPAGSYATMAYDVATRTAVLFRGDTSTGQQFNNTWTWDGTTWTQQPVWSPYVGDGVMAYDAATNQVVLFGDLAGVVNTSTWDGTAWTQQSPATSPPARFGASMAYDEASGKLVLFGGDNGGTGVLADTWTWDGTDWTQESPATSPPARSGASMAYDASTGTAVLFGGDNGGTSLVGDTWTWDGTTWTQQCTNQPCAGSAPAPRSGMSMVYDPQTSTTVQFGGFSEQGCYTRTCPPEAETWTWGPIPPTPGKITLGRPAGKTLAISQQAQLKGSVLDTGGQPIPNFRVNLSTVWGAVDSPVTTGGDGSFKAGFTPTSVGTVSVTASAGTSGSAPSATANFNVVNGITLGLTGVDPKQINTGATNTIAVGGFGFEPTSAATVTLTGAGSATHTYPATIIDAEDLLFTPSADLPASIYEVKVTQNGVTGRLPNALFVVSDTGPTTVNIFGLQITYQGKAADDQNNTVYAGPILIGDPNQPVLTWSGYVTAMANGSLEFHGPLDDPDNGTLTANTPIGPLPIWNGSFTTPASGVISFLSGNSALSLAGFSVQLTQLTVNGNTVTLAGSISLPGGASHSVNNFTIDPGNGVIGSISVDNLSILGVGISGSISFDQPNNHFAGAGKITVPWGTLGGGGVGFWNGGLQSVDLTAGLNPPLPLGPTGIFLNSVTGGGTGFVQPPLTFDLAANFSWPSPGSTGLLTGNVGATLVVGGSFTIAGQVNLNLLGQQIPLASAQLGVYGDHMHAGAQVSVGPFSGSVTLTLYYDGTFSGNGQMQVCPGRPSSGLDVTAPG